MVVEKRKSDFLKENFGGRKDIGFIERSDGIVEVYCGSRYDYDEIKEPLEQYGYKVYCGTLSKRQRR